MSDVETTAPIAVDALAASVDHRPVVTHDLGPITVTTIQGGVQFTRTMSAADPREAVERATISGLMA